MLQYLGSPEGKNLAEPMKKNTIMYNTFKPSYLYNITELDTGYTPPQLLPCPIDGGKTMMYSMVYKPHNYEPGRRYPTILYVYGGPQVQMVINSNRALR